MISQVPSPDDAARQARLDKTRARATGMLLVAAAVFLVARHFTATYPILDWVRAASEAALVGGLADWFAVTALFRHPMGIPIPHTAIVVKQQERIGRVLGNFVQRHFLTSEVVTHELRRLGPAARSARWLSTPEHSVQVASYLHAGFVRALRSVPDEEFRETIRRAAVDRLEKTHVAPILGDFLESLTTDQRHHALLDQAIRVVVTSLEENGALIRAEIGKETPWYVPRLVESAIYSQVMRSAHKLLVDVEHHPGHPLRRKFDEALGTFTERLKTSPEISARADAIRSHVLSKPVIEDLVDGVWDAVRASAFERADGAPSEGISNAIRAAATAVLENQAILKEIDDMLIDRACAAVERHRAEIGELIARTISAWDSQVAATRLELAVGPDLQYIRINGTIVGALAGVLIHALSMVLP